ncbi:MAG: Spy/CpxP family protein refolding chaperone, partial [Candidatus Methylomirabilis sp.]|nr:Spy/CpxP family protein refolding chaperone [Deltaproteobacteria bacterium]
MLILGASAGLPLAFAQPKGMGGPGGGPGMRGKWREEKAALQRNYPAPWRALQHAEAIELTEDQKKTIQEISDRAQADADRLHREIDAKRAPLTKAIADGTLTESLARSVTEETAKLKGEMRYLRLAAHLKTKEALTAEQVKQLAEIPMGRRGGPMMG